MQPPPAWRWPLPSCRVSAGDAAATWSLSGPLGEQLKVLSRTVGVSQAFVGEAGLPHQAPCTACLWGRLSHMLTSLIPSFPAFYLREVLGRGLPPASVLRPPVERRGLLTDRCPYSDSVPHALPLLAPLQALLHPRSGLPQLAGALNLALGKCSQGFRLQG